MRPDSMSTSTWARNALASRLVRKVLARCRPVGSRQFARQLFAGVRLTCPIRPSPSRRARRAAGARGTIQRLFPARIAGSASERTMS